MAKITGTIVRMNTFDTVQNAAGQTVMILQGGSIVAAGEVDGDECFAIDLPAELRGEIEVQLGMHSAAPVITSIDDDQDLQIQLFYNNTAYYA